ncbi:helix-turn-helix domain-containing protein [Nocardia wallacei]|uniref:helix-turn-helix domain-containing protein n=1 Tax=Nocardia wallacei TaxID=480035 RepID=UPI002455DB47|nr:helix-turn-helix domain-containing protein [Nocardia wallacei]
MADAHMAIAHYLRERREAAGLTRAELAQRAGVSEALIQKIEQGTRAPTPTALIALSDALRIPTQFVDHALELLQPARRQTTDLYGDLAEGEIDFLNSLPHPACYLTLPARDLIAVNDAHRRYFPTLLPGTNVIAWTLLDPIARHVLADWEQQAHVLVQAFRYMAPGVVTPERCEEIIRMCRAAPEWDRLWSTDLPPDNIPHPVRMRSPETGEWCPMHVHLFKIEIPTRPWWLYSLMPAR